MTLTYLNGVAPAYAGYTFSDTTDLIDTIESTLNTAGWVTVDKVSGVSLFVRGTAEVGNADNCWLEFTITGTSPSLTLNLQGWLQEAKTNGSGTSGFGLTFKDALANSLWLTADSGALAICIISNDGTARGLHFGFCDRLVASDATAIYIGKIGYDSYSFARVATAINGGTIWQLLRASFVSLDSGQSASSGTYWPRAGTADLLKAASGGNTASTTSWSVTGSNFGMAISQANPGSSDASFGNGMRNWATGKPLLSDYFYFEGPNTTSVNNYATINQDGYNIRYAISLRGTIPYCVCGLGGEPAGWQYESTDGSRYLSVGGGNGWQGMLIYAP